MTTLGRAALSLAFLLALGTPAAAQSLNPNPPSSPVRLVFIHHSTGQNWLADWDGTLGLALRDSNYFVSDTNYGWGPDDGEAGGAIGDHTDIGHWYSWFSGPYRTTYLPALYAESGMNSDYSRLATNPGGENRIVLFKSCFPNSALGGSPSDPVPPIDSNPLRGQDAWSEAMTVANAKGIYNELLAYFATRTDKLFVAITAPPLIAAATDATQAGNARAFNDWLVNDWLDGYPHHNVVVFDFFDVLTSNGGSNRTNAPDTNDLGWADGNHHRYRNGAIEHMQTVTFDYSAYGTSDSHPSRAGNLKATGELVSFLNVAYHCWTGDGGCPGAPAPTPPTITDISPLAGPIGTTVTVTGTGFAGVTSTEFAGVAADFTVVSTTQLTAIVPLGAGAGPITVTTPSGTATSTQVFTPTLPPTITDISPLAGPIGTTVTVTGTGFAGATSVEFAGVAADFTVVSTTQLTAIVPLGAGAGPITVTTPSGTATSTQVFTPTLPGLSIIDVSVTEPDPSPASSATFEVILSPAHPMTVTVSYATSDGSASAGSDYVAASGSLTFAPGETGKTVTVSITPDSQIEADETFFVTLSAPVNAVIARGQGVGTIVDDDGVAPPETADRYRLFSDITKEHHYTTDAYEYFVLGTRGWIQEGVAHRVYLAATPVSGVTPVSLYRLYHPGIRQHLWTTDRNEYDVLGTRGWTQENVDGYILPSAIPGLTVPLYRLAHVALPLHLWTTDLNEYTVLATRGWAQEGVVGHALP